MLMRIAFLTDIHGNLEALESVLQAIETIGYDRLVILGDLVGYGPDPIAVVEIVSELIEKGAVCVKGNHDEAAMIGGAGMSENARVAINWTIERLHAPHKEFLTALPMQVIEDDRLYIHASADRPDKWPYIRDTAAADRCLAATDARLIFAGHTHIPVIFHGLPGRATSAFVPKTDIEMPISSMRRAVTIVGSVGQPRDGIAGACYCLFDTAQRTITMKRVSYDFSETAQKIRSAGLPLWLADRLGLGK
jgi:diadenosine tetraphosphatase ApaH/serine/threonine PP2A family protein phosphatase